MGHSSQIISLNNGNCFKISGQMTGKMIKIRSLNTSHSLNPYCQENRKNKNSICSSCYSYVSEKRYIESKKMWSLNYNILSTHVLKDNEVPTLRKSDSIFRFNAHGDLINRIHYNNLIKIVKKNPEVLFALWTKNLKVINKGKGIVKLDNIQYIYSDIYLNNLNTPIVPEGFDRLFRVYDTKTLRANNSIVVNCPNSCFKCQVCYKQNDTKVIIEKIKSRFK